MIPFSSWFVDMTLSKVLVIKVADQFDNPKFNAKSIDVTLSAQAVTLASATIQVKTALRGLRYFMREWFFTTAFVAIMASGFMIFLVLLAFLSVARSNLKPFIFRLSKKSTKKEKKKAKAVGKKVYRDEHSQDPTTNSEDEYIGFRQRSDQSWVEQALLYVGLALIE